jgi:glutamine synthetase
VLARARDFCLLSVPTVNGYRRVDPQFTLSPTRVDWSFEDRSAMIRVSGGDSSTHLENRVGEPCANPYLAIAAQLFAGLDGLIGDARPAEPARPGAAPGAERPGSAAEGGLPDALPLSLREAVAAFGGSHAQELLGAPLVSCLTKIKESEVARFEDWCATAQPAGDDVTEWEQREYFDAF